MRLRIGWIWAAGVGTALAMFSTVRASDHLDGPRATANSQADIADVFAFTSPENPAHVVLAMTVTPFASASSRFSSQVDYAFRIRRVTASQPITLEPAVLDVTCDFDDAAPQNVTCSSPSGLRLTTAVGDRTAGGSALSPIRVFAGMRSDPAFFDRQGALTTMASARDRFTGRNAFDGANVLALVVEVDSATALVPADAGAKAKGSAAPTILAVAAETASKGP
jgi:hypothetical protein